MEDTFKNKIELIKPCLLIAIECLKNGNDEEDRQIALNELNYCEKIINSHRVILKKLSDEDAEKLIQY